MTDEMAPTTPRTAVAMATAAALPEMADRP